MLKIDSCQVFRHFVMYYIYGHVPTYSLPTLLIKVTNFLSVNTGCHIKFYVTKPPNSSLLAHS